MVPTSGADPPQLVVQAFQVLQILITIYSFTARIPRNRQTDFNDTGIPNTTAWLLSEIQSIPCFLLPSLTGILREYELIVSTVVETIQSASGPLTVEIHSDFRQRVTKFAEQFKLTLATLHRDMSREANGVAASFFQNARNIIITGDLVNTFGQPTNTDFAPEVLRFLKEEGEARQRLWEEVQRSQERVMQFGVLCIVNVLFG